MIIKLHLSYKGTDFNGFQIQNIDGEENPKVKTIQGTLNKALRTLLNDESISVVGSSRTDSGVHARYYVASFFVEKPIVPPEKISLAVKHLLPESISVFKSEVAEDTFNARFDTKNKTYHYYFYTGESNAPVLLDNAYHVKAKSLNLEKMQEASKYFLGTHEFDAFATQGDANKGTTRTIFDMSINIVQNDVLLDGEMFCLSITGDGFLYNMVRIITGTIIMVGEGKINPLDIPEIIKSKDRKKAGTTAPAQGLYLWDVVY